MIFLNFISASEDFLQISSGLDPWDWRKYRRRLTKAVSSDVYLYIDEGGSASFVFASGASTAVTRSVNVRVSTAPGLLPPMY